MPVLQGDALPVTTFAPPAQASVDAYADVGTYLDAYTAFLVSFTIKENNVNAIKWQVIGANDSAFVAPVTVQAEATVAKNASSFYGDSAPVYRYYKVQVKANVGSSQGNVTVIGIAKG